MEPLGLELCRGDVSGSGRAWGTGAGEAISDGGELCKGDLGR